MRIALVVFFLPACLAFGSGDPTVEVDSASMRAMEELSLAAFSDKLKIDSFRYAGTKEGWHLVLRDDSFIDDDFAGIQFYYEPFKIPEEDVEISDPVDLSETDKIGGFLCAPIKKLKFKKRLIICKPNSTK